MTFPTVLDVYDARRRLLPRLSPTPLRPSSWLSDAAGGPVTVKGRRAEGLGALGRTEGIACWAVALVTRAEA